jgi:nucleoid-associated protein YgaU
MARETKVGLLVGLAFIICFAVILSNRGREDSVASTVPFLPDMIGGAPQVAPTSPKTAVGLPTGVAPAGAAHPPSSGTILPMTEPVLTQREENLERKVRDLEEQLARAAGATIPAQPQVSLSGQPATFVPPNAASGTSTVDPAVSAPRQSAAADDSSAYTVRAGDTLFTIAQSHYGTRSKRVLDAIFDANRKHLPDRNQIRPGMVLRLPKLNDAPAKPVQRASDHAANEAKRPQGPAPKPTAQAFTWYQVRKNDRYASIAREVLGDGSRWREIHELNKDKFPNPDQIREGVRIKIPSRARG